MSRRLHLLKVQQRPAETSTRFEVSSQSRHEALCRELQHLRTEIKRLKSVILVKDRALVNQAQFLEEILRGAEPPTYDALKRRISRLKGAVDRIQGGLPE